MPPALVFDVNETLLNLKVMDGAFRRLFGETAARKEWFSQLLQLALVVTVTDTYRDFRTLAGEALDAVALRRGTDLTGAERLEILEQITHLPPHPDVPEALARLRAAGFTLAALTNSPPDTVQAQLTNAGLIDLFHTVMSVHETKRFKPHPAPYQMAARKLEREPAELWMVAAHDWDIAGAMEVGYCGAFIARPLQGYAAGYQKPGLVGSDLTEIADRLIGQVGK